MPAVDLAIYLTVRGRVQGVGFRFHAERWARQLGIRGWARNRSDGAVEILAIGPADALAHFRQRIEDGPPAARVIGVERETAPLTPEDLARYPNFTVVPSV